MIRKTSIWSRTVSHMQIRSNVGDKTVGFYSIYIFISVIIYCATTGAYQYEAETNKKLMRTRGDIVLGGIFPMHEQINTNNEYPCGDIKKEKGVQRLEAMLYAIDLINEDPLILPNITLGTLIIDSCSSDTYALEQSMEFVRYYMNKVGHFLYFLFFFLNKISFSFFLQMDNKLN